MSTRLRFLGANALHGTDLPAVCRELRLEGVVEFLPRVPRQESLRAMMTANALLLLQPGHTVSVPGKVYEYLATGRPILAMAEEGEISGLLQQTNTGVWVSPDDHEGMIGALAGLVQRPAIVDLPRRELYDGNVRAGHIADILAQAAARVEPAVRIGDVEATS